MELVRPWPLRRWIRVRPSLRLRLAVLYGSLFLLSGAALLGVTYLLVDHATSSVLFLQGKNGEEAFFGTSKDESFGVAQVTKGDSSSSIGFVKTKGQTSGTAASSSGGSTTPAGGQPSGTVRVPVPGVPPGKVPTPQQAQQQLAILRREAVAQHNNEMHQLLLKSGIALGLAAALSAVLGWLLAGRALRPVKRMTSTAREITSSNLRQRIALEGPDDEIKELGDTFDELLDRLQCAFDAQRQFVANASHELRTPLARQRTLLEVALDDPAADVESLRTAARQILAAGEDQERLVEALLTLAVSERGLDHRDPVDLGSQAEAVVSARRSEAAARGLTLQCDLRSAPTLGSDRLVARLVANLIDNALRYNIEGGHVDVTTGVRGERAVVRVTNAGPVVPPDAVDRLLQPFERLENGRTAKAGHGIGLSIVAAVADAHDAEIAIDAPPSGGLEVEVSFVLALASARGRAQSDGRKPCVRDELGTVPASEDLPA